jgi:hypothetical protein
MFSRAYIKSARVRIFPIQEESESQKKNWKKAHERRGVYYKFKDLPTRAILSFRKWEKLNGNDPLRAET